MQETFTQLIEQCKDALKAVGDRVALESVEIKFLGRKGELASLMKQLAALSDEEKKSAGKIANEAKEKIEQMIAKAKEKIAREEEKTRANREWVDVTAPGVFPKEGHLHPVSQAIQEITDVFAQIGFVSVRAPEIDWDWYVFESLNMPPDHPARDDWETFFIAETKGQKARGEKGRLVLTPHTSNAQVREMEKGKLPIRMININRTYRRQSDPSHTPMFHQFEGLVIDEGITIAHLKGVLDYFAKSFFGPDRQIRLRPHHFRFTEPSFEVDISCGACGGKGACRICKAGWLELGGAGMVHPNVLKAGGLDPEKVSGFAFGWGVERTLVMKEGTKIDDIRILYKNDLRFIKQF